MQPFNSLFDNETITGRGRKEYAVVLSKMERVVLPLQHKFHPVHVYALVSMAAAHLLLEATMPKDKRPSRHLIAPALPSG